MRRKMGQETKHPGTSKEEFIVSLSFNKAKKDYQAFARKQGYEKTGLAVILILLVVVIGLATALGVKGSSCEEIVTYALCPDGWIGYLGNCYYFSDDEADWLSSLRNCSALGASLSAIETEHEMAFLLRYKGPIYHWIGLRKEQRKSWEWANGEVFNNTLFEIVEGGDCAYLNDVAVMSSWCRTKKNWICSKPDASVHRRQPMEETGVKQAYMNESHM